MPRHDPEYERIEVEPEQLADVGYRAFARARLGARKVLGQEAEDLHLAYDLLGAKEKDAWAQLAARVFGMCGEAEGQSFLGLAKAAATIWEEITGIPRSVFSGPTLLGLEAFVRTVAAFLDEENDRDDIEELCAGNYDWIRWGKYRQEQSHELRGEMSHAR